MSDVVRAYSNCCYGPKEPEFQRFCHDPYNATSPWSAKRCHTIPVSSTPGGKCECFNGGSAPAMREVEHVALLGKVGCFVPFDRLACSPRCDPSPNSDLQWVYIGQMPFDLAVQYVLRIIYAAAPFATVYELEPHFKMSKKTLMKVYDGSVFALVSHAHEVVECINKRVLVEGCGVWFASGCKEMYTLKSYINTMGPALRAQHKLGFIHVPYATATCEISRSRNA